jgi:hypothetical protein
VIQRFGGALNLNVHVHALVLDGVFAKDDAGRLVFHPAPRLTALDVAEVLATVEPRIRGLLNRRGLGDDDVGAAQDVWADASPVLAGFAAASVQGIVATGPCRGARVRRLGEAPEIVQTAAPGPCHARSNGFDLHAGLVVPAGHRDRLERVCRYTLRPPVPSHRLRVTGDGQVTLQLRHRWADGTTHLVFDPVEFLGRLAVLVPRPRTNLVLYHGVLGPRAGWRAEIVRRETSAGEREVVTADAPGAPAEHADAPDGARPHAGGYEWAELMRRTFGIDVLACPRCGGRLRLIALVEEAAVIDRILRHLGLPTAIPTPRPARAPPLAVDVRDGSGWRDEPSAFDACS